MAVIMPVCDAPYLWMYKHLLNPSRIRPQACTYFSKEIYNLFNSDSLGLRPLRIWLTVQVYQKGVYSNAIKY